MKRARTAQVVLVAFLVQLVIVVGLGNPGVARRLQDYVAGNPNGFFERAGYSVLTLSWRFSPLASDTQHIWLSQILSLLTLFAVTALLVLITVRGPVTLIRAFVTISMAVIVAAGLAGYVRRLVVEGFGQRGTSRATDAVFSVLSGFDFFLGLLLGLVVGLIAGTVAASTQRLSSTVAAAPGSGPAPASGPYAAPPAWAPGPPAEPARHAVAASGPPPDDFAAARRAEAGAREPAADQTAVLPRHGDGPPPTGDTSGAAGETTRLPRAQDEPPR